MLRDRNGAAFAAAGARRPGLPRWLVLTTAAVFVFIAGLCIPYRRAVRFEAQLEDTSRALALARLQNTLAAAGLEARQGRYETGRQLASEFFSGLQRVVDDTPTLARPQARDEVRRILLQRDTTITVLSRGAGTSAEMLDGLLGRYREVVRQLAGPEPGARPPGSSTPAVPGVSGARR